MLHSAIAKWERSFGLYESILHSFFELKWTLEDRSPYAGGSEGRLPANYLDGPNTPPLSSGGGIYLSSCTATLQSVFFRLNSVEHPVAAFGGAAVISTASTSQKKSAVSFLYCSFVSNWAVANIAGGGAVVAVTEVDVVLESTLFLTNRIVGTGKCLRDLDENTECPASFGGAVAVFARGSISARDCRFERNGADCQNRWGTGCGVHGGAVAVSGEGLCSLAASFLLGNVVNCTTLIGCWTGAGGAVYGDHRALVGMTGCDVLENSVTGIGQGGGVAASQAALTLVERTRIMNNTAREGSKCKEF